MATTKTPRAATIADLHQPKPLAVDVDSHAADLKRRAEESEKRCSLIEKLRLCNPLYAAEVEAKKPLYKWRVEFQIMERKVKGTSPKDRYANNYGDDDDNNRDWDFRTITKTAEAQNEADAWAEVCDEMKLWPSPRSAQPKFTKLKQVKT